MKCFLSSVFILVGCNLFAFSQKAAPPPPPPPLIYKVPEKSDLKEFVSEDKTFQITFPGVPSINKQEISNGSATSYRVYRQGSNSVVSAIDYNFDLENNIENIYETIRNNLLKVPKSTIEAEKDIETGGIKGKEFDVLQDYNFQKVRILIVGRRIYEIKSDVTNWHILTKYNQEKVADFKKEAERFFDSFKFLISPVSIAFAAPENFVGKATETNYTNDFFNFTLDYPKDWHRLNEEDVKKNTVSASEFYRTLGERNDKAFQESLKREVLLFAVSQRNETVEKGTNINIGLIKQPNSQANAKDIALATKKLVLLNPNSKVLKEIEDININGTLFSTATFQTDNNGQPIYQKILVIIRKGYSLTFVLSYKNEQGQKSLEDIAKSLRFDNK